MMANGARHSTPAATRPAAVEIDGAHGEGGGQLVRTAVALAALRGVPLQIGRIRARRRKPGLAAQHVAAVRAVAALCDARCEGVEVGAQSLAFTPRRLHGGEFVIDVGTAGSITLVLQAVLPCAVACRERVVVKVRGGTDVRAAPPLDYLRWVLLPLLARLGVHAELELLRRGYFPPGGGEVRLIVEPASRLQPLFASRHGALRHIDIHAHVARLPLQIAQRMAAAAQALLPTGVPCESFVDSCAPQLAASPGGALLLRAHCAQALLGAAVVAQRGVPAEQLGQEAAQALLRDLNAGATLDTHAADQILVYLASASGPSVFRAAPLSLHATTAMWLLERLAGTRFEIAPDAAGATVHVHPAGPAAGASVHAPARS